MLLKPHFNGVRFSYGFRSLIYYSTTSSKPIEKTHEFVVDYLVKSLGFSEEEAISASTKVTPFKSTKNPDSVINFLKQSGFDKTQIKKIVYCVPRILRNKVKQTLKPKIKAFQDIGLSESEVVDLLSATPSVLLCCLNSGIKQSLEVLKILFSSNKDLIACIKRSSAWMITANAPRYLQRNVTLLRSCGVSTDEIEKLIYRRPRVLLHRDKWLQDVVVRVEEHLGIPRSSPMFLKGLTTLARLKQKTMESKLQVFKSYGWTESDILTIVRKFPHYLSLSEIKIRSSLDFFMKKLGHGPAYFEKHPTLVTYSLEKRVLPRIAVLEALRDRQLLHTNLSLTYILSVSEYQFLKRFVLPFKDEAPKVCRDYMNSAGTNLEAVK